MKAINKNNSYLDRHWQSRFKGYGYRCEEESYISGWTEHGLQRRVLTFKRTLCNSMQLNEKDILVLDAGCGSGTYSRLMHDLGCKVIGIDYSFPSLRKASSLNKGRKISYVVANIYHLPVADKRFDIVFCFGAFQAMSNVVEAINSISRVLNSEGTLYLMTLNSWNLLASIRNLARKINKFTWILRTKSEKNGNLLQPLERSPLSIKRMLKSVGFKELKINWVFVFPSYLIWLEKLLEKKGIIKTLEKKSIYSQFIARSFIIIGQK